jgi:hypothetical protein
MESLPDMPGETKAGKFARLIRTERVTRYALYWPFGANRAGLDVEIGLILERLHREEILGEYVRVLIEDDGAGRSAGALEATSDGRVEFVPAERGRRTVYYGDLVQYGAILTTWADYGELFELLENIASD